MSIHDAIDREGNNTFKNRSFRWNGLRLARKLFTINMEQFLLAANISTCTTLNIHYSHLHFIHSDENVFVGRWFLISELIIYIDFDRSWTVKNNKLICLDLGLVLCFRCRYSIFGRNIHFDWLTIRRHVVISNVIEGELITHFISPQTIKRLALKEKFAFFL